MACLRQQVGRPGVTRSAQMSDHTTIHIIWIPFRYLREAPTSALIFWLLSTPFALSVEFLGNGNCSFLSWVPSQARGHVLSPTLTDTKTSSVSRDLGDHIFCIVLFVWPPRRKLNHSRQGNKRTWNAQKKRYSCASVHSKTWLFWTWSRTLRYPSTTHKVNRLVSCFIN